LSTGRLTGSGVDLALREFVSNSLDSAMETGKADYYKDVKVEIVEESQVRAKAGCTRVFIPMNDDVFKFYNNIGKWFLHFSEPENLGKALLPKSNRNLDTANNNAVIYRRGVRVREFEASKDPSLFDYNVTNLDMDESRKVNDWYVAYEAAKALGVSKEGIAAYVQSLMGTKKYWEHSFDRYGFDSVINYGSVETKKHWTDAFESVAGTNAVIATAGGGEVAKRKGYKVVEAPEVFVEVAKKAGINTPDKVLSNDERDGIEVMDSTPTADMVADYVWDMAVKFSLTNLKAKPKVKTFNRVWDQGGQTLGYYRDGTIFLNRELLGSHCLSVKDLPDRVIAVAMEETVHHITGAVDFSRDFQDCLLNFVVKMARERM
jgi:hypothetical protein